MVEFITIDETEVKFGDNKFVEIAHKKAIIEDEEDKPFISIVRGYYKDGIDKKFIKTISISTVEKQVLKDIVKALVQYID